MEMLRIGQIVKHPTIGIGIVVNVMILPRRNIYHILSDIFYSVFDFGSDDKISDCCKISRFVKILSSSGLHDYWMEDWSSITKEELNAFIEQNILFGFAWAPIENIENNDYSGEAGNRKVVEILRIAQIAKNFYSKEIGVVVDVNKRDKNMNTFQMTLHTISLRNLLYTRDCLKLGFGWKSFLHCWEDTYFIKVICSGNIDDYCMDEWESVTKEELHTYLKEKGSLLGFTWVPVAN